MGSHNWLLATLMGVALLAACLISSSDRVCADDDDFWWCACTVCSADPVYVQPDFRQVDAAHSVAMQGTPVRELQAARKALRHFDDRFPGS